MIGSKRVRRTLAVLAIALLCRAAIPVGYMPAPAGSGLLFEMCPSGLPSGFLAALGGNDHHAHHVAGDSTAAHVDAGDCPIGHMLSSAAAVDGAASTVLPQSPSVLTDPAVPLFHSHTYPSQRPRGPPT